MTTRGLSAWARVEPTRPAILSGERIVTYADLDERSTRLAHALAARGIGAGDRVAIMVPNSVEVFETWAAASKVGAAVVPVNWHLKADELAYILTDSAASALVAHTDLSDHVTRAREAVPECEVLVVGAADG